MKPWKEGRVIFIFFFCFCLWTGNTSEISYYLIHSENSLRSDCFFLPMAQRTERYSNENALHDNSGDLVEAHTHISPSKSRRLCGHTFAHGHFEINKTQKFIRSPVCKIRLSSTEQGKFCKWLMMFTKAVLDECIIIRMYYLHVHSYLLWTLFEVKANPTPTTQWTKTNVKSMTLPSMTHF